MVGRPFRRAVLVSERGRPTEGVHLPSKSPSFLWRLYTFGVSQRRMKCPAWARAGWGMSLRAPMRCVVRAWNGDIEQEWCLHVGRFRFVPS